MTYQPAEPVCQFVGRQRRAIPLNAGVPLERRLRAVRRPFIVKLAADLGRDRLDLVDDLVFACDPTTERLQEARFLLVWRTTAAQPLNKDVGVNVADEALDVRWCPLRVARSYTPVMRYLISAIARE